MRAGLKRVVIPSENEVDLDELPPETLAALQFVPAETIDDVFAAAFDGRRRARPQSTAPALERQAARSTRR
jgi:ATP-dependent Lon protease